MATREQAINWWDGLFEYINPSGINKSALTEKYFKDRIYHSLKGREIEEIWCKEVKTEENIYLNRLKEQYKELKVYEVSSLNRKYRKLTYDAMRLFCLDCSLLSFAKIELMENEIDSKL